MRPSFEPIDPRIVEHPSGLLAGLLDHFHVDRALAADLAECAGATIPAPLPLSADRTVALLGEFHMLPTIEVTLGKSVDRISNRRAHTADAIAERRCHALNECAGQPAFHDIELIDLEAPDGELVGRF